MQKRVNDAVRYSDDAQVVMWCAMDGGWLEEWMWWNQEPEPASHGSGPWRSVAVDWLPCLTKHGERGWAAIGKLRHCRLVYRIGTARRELIARARARAFSTCIVCGHHTGLRVVTPGLSAVYGGVVFTHASDGYTTCITAMASTGIQRE